MNASLSEGSQVWYQLTVMTGSGEGCWKERRAVNVGGDDVSRSLVTLHLLQSSGVADGDVEVPRKGHLSVRMTTEHGISQSWKVPQSSVTR